jgi:prevent-host-death family protein
MNSIGSYEAKTHLPRLLERVAKGERITITKHGAPVAMLVPVSSSAKPEVQEVIDALKEFRRGRTLNGLTVREMIDEGRKY